MTRSLLPVVAIIGTVIAVAPVRGMEVHEVQQMSDLSFQPPDITVAPGDLVRWLWGNGTHTVTSGADCTPDGLYFDEALLESNPVVEWTVPAEAEGLVEYHCIPHCAIFDMKGTITVERIAGPCPGDVDDDGRVDFVDLVTLLSNWGPCEPPCPSDIDGNGAVEFSDLLTLLSSWGDCP